MSDQIPDRRGNPELRQRFQQAVTEASFNAAQQVAAIHRRRLVVQSFIAAAVAMSAIAIPVILVTTSSERSFSRRNALYDCQLFKAADGYIGDFVLSDARLRDRQNRQGLSGELAKDFGKIIPHGTLARLAAAQQRDVARVVARWYRDAAGLEMTAGTDCASHLG